MESYVSSAFMVPYEFEKEGDSIVICSLESGENENENENENSFGCCSVYLYENEAVVWRMKVGENDGSLLKEKELASLKFRPE